MEIMFQLVITKTAIHNKLLCLFIRELYWYRLKIISYSFLASYLFEDLTSLAGSLVSKNFSTLSCTIEVVMIVVFVDRLHDRKLCVLGMCTLLSMSPHRPVVLNECVQQIIPSLIVLFEGLKRAYAGMFLYYKSYFKIGEDQGILRQSRARGELSCETHLREHLIKTHEKGTKTSTVILLH